VFRINLKNNGIRLKSSYITARKRSIILKNKLLNKLHELISWFVDRVHFGTTRIEFEMKA